MPLTKIQQAILIKLENGTPLNGTMVQQLIYDHRTTKDETYALYERYKASVAGVPIFNRTMPNVQKINNKINNDFFGEIVNVKVGYMFGNPISYGLDKNKYVIDPKKKKLLQKVKNVLALDKSEATYEQHTDFISDFCVRNNVQDLDSEIGKIVAACRYAGREIYIDTEGNERIANLYPWETIFLTNSNNEVLYALRYYPVLADDNITEITKVEWFDSHSITYLVEQKDMVNGLNVYDIDHSVPLNPKPHVFNYCPVVKLVNNAEELADPEKVLAEIDGYDRTVSDMNSEIEAFRLSYMKFKGDNKPTTEIIDAAKQTGAFYAGKDGDVDFITKQMNDTAIENHLKRLERDIMRFASHVNFNDEAFGNLSGIAMGYKLFNLESKCKTMETKMKSMLAQQFKILSSAWTKKNIDINYLNIFFDFKRNIQIDAASEIESNGKLKGLVSERTRLSRLSFVDDVEYEIDQMEEDNQGQTNLFDQITKDNATNTDTNTNGGNANESSTNNVS